MIIDITPKQQASLDRAWSKRLAAKAAAAAAKAAYRASSGFDVPAAQALYRAWKDAEAIEARTRGVCLRLDYLYRYKPEIDKQA
jgi:hypothetical protein